MTRPRDPGDHPDHFTLLLFVGDELDDLQRRRLERHFAECAPCRADLAALRRLDAVMQEHHELIFETDAAGGGLDPEDPFLERPEEVDRLPSEFGFGGPGLSRLCFDAAKAATPLRDQLLDAEGATLTEALAALNLSGLPDRYALGYALDEAPHRMAEAPLRFRALAEGALERLSREEIRPFYDAPPDAVTTADFAYPLIELRAKAHLLDGIICNWTAEYGRGAASFQAAWRDFAAGRTSHESLALVELHESQRRAYAGEAGAALLLALRAEATFIVREREDQAARAAYAAGVALSELGRDEEALSAFRRALPVFEAWQLWNALVSTLHAIGAALAKLGRIAEARREFARALQQTVRGGRPAAHAFLQQSLGTALFRAERYAEALRAFRVAARLFERQGAHADGILVRLYVAECQARTGGWAAARETLAGVLTDLRRLPGIDPKVAEEVERSVAGAEPNLAALASLRERAQELLQGSRA